MWLVNNLFKFVVLLFVKKFIIKNIVFWINIYLWILESDWLLVIFFCKRVINFWNLMKNKGIVCDGDIVRFVCFFWINFKYFLICGCVKGLVRLRWLRLFKMDLSLLSKEFIVLVGKWWGYLYGNLE